jgi:hypothetical protein
MPPASASCLPAFNFMLPGFSLCLLPPALMPHALCIKPHAQCTMHYAPATSSLYYTRSLSRHMTPNDSLESIQRNYRSFQCATTAARILIQLLV